MKKPSFLSAFKSRKGMQALLYFTSDSRFILFNLVLLFFLVNGITREINVRVDFTRDRIHSLSESTEQILATIQDPLLIEAYISRDLPGEILSMIEPVLYQLHAIQNLNNGRVNVRIIDPDNEQLREQAESRGIQGIPVERTTIDERTQKIGYFGVYIQSGEENSVIDLVEDGSILENFEYHLLKEVRKFYFDLSGKIALARVPGTVAVRRWQNREDQNKDNLYGFRTIAESDLGTFADEDLNSPISKAVETLIVAGRPRLQNQQVIHLNNYIAEGGNVLFMLGAFDFDLSSIDPALSRYGMGNPEAGQVRMAENELREMNTWLQQFGLRLQSHYLLEPNLAAAEMDVMGEYLVPARNPAWAVYRKSSGIQINDPALRSVEQIVLPWFSSFEILEDAPDSIEYNIWVQSTEDAIMRNEGSLRLQDLQNVHGPYSNRRLPLIVYLEGNFSDLQLHDSSSLEQRTANREQPRPQIIEATDEQKSRLVFISSPYMVSDIFFRNQQNMEIYALNQAFLFNILEFLSGDEALIAARSKVRTVDYISLPTWMASDSFEFVFEFLHILLIPVFLAVYGMMRLLTRNQRRGLTISKASESDAEESR